MYEWVIGVWGLLTNLEALVPAWAALVGGLTGAIATGVVRAWLDKRARDRERKGLLHILDAELYENNRLLEGIKQSAELAHYPSQSHLSTDAWNQSRARLGNSLSKDSDHIVALNRHYALVVRIRATLEDREELDKSLSPEELKKNLSRKQRRDPQKREQIENLREQVGKATVEGKNLLSNLAKQALSAGEKARGKGEKYLGPLPDYYREDELPTNP